MGRACWLLWALAAWGAALGAPGAGPGAPGPRLGWNATFCHRAVPAPGPGPPLRSLSFLSRRPHGPALFHARWDERGHLLECAFWEEAAPVRAYRAACARDRAGVFARAPSPPLRRALGALREQRDACVRSEGDPPSVGQETPGAAAGPRRRAKRGWTMPGTLWCGVGDSAGNSTDLGLFQGPDLCCREHDLCTQNIAPFQYNYGIRNYRFHTISHCDCDSRFHSCLQRQQDAISDFVGTTFFNLLEIPCFVLEEKEACVQWYWWGGCKKYGPISQARLLQQSRYNVTRAPPSPAVKASRRKQQRQRPGSRFRPSPPLPSGPQRVNCSAQPPSPNVPGLVPSMPTTPEQPARISGDPYTEGRPWNGGRRPGGNQAAGGAAEGAAQGPPETPAPEGAGPKGTLHPVDKNSIYQDLSEPCGCYRELDLCPHKIEPRETKYRLHNSGGRTLFHCNCTRRLAKLLRTRSPNEVEDKLWPALARTCFELRPPEACEPSRGCREEPRAVVVPARHLRRLRKKPAGWLRGVRAKVVEKPLKKRKRERRPRTRARELRGALPLYDRCREMVSAWRWAPR
ncbi:group 3 secretory phospholipase A2 [Antechinus flavipes]|uniref:group 3 secretory phospholipase A2 n=1 Tax=Antechinus flavipes TaxID=38775 RepID=UPI0022354427|nr:group 3 secretory phospholipase A2 [Antechinus flavipes]